MIIIGKKYVNKNTGRTCTVKGKNFYNIRYEEEGEENQNPSYTHYKTFQKHWEIKEAKIPEQDMKDVVNGLFDINWKECFKKDKKEAKQTETNH